jgi:fibronectin type 3 domain-containing protein
VRLPASNLDAAEATPLASNSIRLQWEPVAKATHYRIYSDMGSGYGVYIFKAETDQPELTDTTLQAGLRYNYRI